MSVELGNMGAYDRIWSERSTQFMHSTVIHASGK